MKAPEQEQDRAAAGDTGDRDVQATAQPDWPEADISRGRGRRENNGSKSGQASEDSTDAPIEAAQSDASGESPSEEPSNRGSVDQTSDEDSAKPGPAKDGLNGSGSADSQPVGSAPSRPATSRSGAPGRPAHFLVEMSRAMQAAAQTARDESLVRLSAEAQQRIEQIQEQGANDTTELRRKADEDIAETREWSKTEIARIREETDRQIAERKADLEGDVERHTQAVQRRTDRVREQVSRHESELDAFIERLLAESDPASIASLAQEAPEPPDFEDDALDGTAAAGRPATGRSSGPRGDASKDTEVEADAPQQIAAGRPTSQGAKLSAAGAAAAEAEALSDLEGVGDRQRGRNGSLDRGSVPSGSAQTELIVSGLASVPGIAGFKRELSRLSGVQAVGVSAGEAGEFLFKVNHEAGMDLAAAVETLAAFDAKLGGSRGASLLVSAREPVAAE
jgi:hypothetical protein